MSQQGQPHMCSCISALPDDLLVGILSRLQLRDAARTTTLSKRWRNCWTTMPYLDLDWCTMSNAPSPFHWEDDCAKLRPTFVQNVEQVLRKYVDHDILSFRLNFCVDMLHAGVVDQWINFAATKSLETLNLEFEFSHSNFTIETVEMFTITSSHLDRLPRLKRLHLQACILKVHSTFAFKRLITLDLTYVRLEGAEWQSLLSEGSTIAILRFRSCNLPPKLCIGDSFSSLSFLTIQYCENLLEIELKAKNLKTFEFIGGEVKLTFKSCPRVDNVFLGPKKRGSAVCVNNLGRDLPSVKSLSLRAYHPLIHYLPTQPGTLFRGVVRLYYSMDYEDKKVLSYFPRLLKSFPNLQTLHLQMPFPFTIDQGECPPPYLHTNLKEVKLSGFNVCFIEFACFLLKSCIALDRMVLDNRDMFYEGFEEWVFTKQYFCKEEFQFIHDKLRGKSLSRIADVIYGGLHRSA